jgi:hypothetical protein
LKAHITFIFWVEDYNARGNKGQQREKQRTQSGDVGILQAMLTLNRARTVFLVQHRQKNIGGYIFTSKKQMHTELNILARNRPRSSAIMTDKGERAEGDMMQNCYETRNRPKK